MKAKGKVIEAIKSNSAAPIANSKVKSIKGALKAEKPASSDVKQIETHRAMNVDESEAMDVLVCNEPSVNIKGSSNRSVKVKKEAKKID